MQAADQKGCWRAVLARDVRFDGVFVYAVRSTGIYCRPSCPSRRPRREQVIFFPLPEAADRAGFRPCRRCRPREAAAGNPWVEAIRRLCRYIEANLEGPLTLTAFSAQVGISPYHLQRTFKRILGVTPRQYADARRMGRFKARLREGQSVAAALYEAGYGSSSRLYERAQAQLGMTPATYRRGGRGMRIGYTIVPCPLGRLLVAASAHNHGAAKRGVCAISLGDSDAAMQAALSAEYPEAHIRRDRNGLYQWLSAVLDHLRGRRPRLDLPLDVQASAFQRQVWEELRRIPYGRTRSYGEIARALGRPKAARAVAHACATNPVALLVPCHRAVRADGQPGGYRWGLERKRALLEQEQRQRMIAPDRRT